jgi:hypothetical protein
MPTTIPTVTSSTRPGSPSAGDAYFETDTKRYIIYDGANWRQYYYDSSLDPSLAASQLSYTGGIYTTSNYTISVQPQMHFDAAILDGSDPLNNLGDGAVLSTWGDRSGQAVNYEASQATASLQPVYKHDGDDRYVQFDGGDGLILANNYQLPTAFNGVFVCNTDVDANQNLPLGTSVNSEYIFLEYNGVTYGLSGTPSIADTTYGPHYNSIQQFWSTRDSSNDHNVYVQGGNSILNYTATNSRTARYIGRANNAFFHTGRIYEIILFGEDLSTTDKNTVRNYLNNKYSGLPTSTAFA